MSGPIWVFAQTAEELNAEKIALDNLLAALLTWEDIDDTDLDSLADEVYENDTLKTDMQEDSTPEPEPVTAPVVDPVIEEPVVEEEMPVEELTQEVIEQNADESIDLSAVWFLMPEQEDDMDVNDSYVEEEFIPWADAFEEDFIPSAEDFEMTDTSTVGEEIVEVEAEDVKENQVLNNQQETNKPKVQITRNTQLLVSDDVEIWVRHVYDEAYEYVDTVSYNDGRYTFAPASNGHHFFRLRGLNSDDNEFTGMEIFLAKDVEIWYKRVEDMRFIESERFLTMIDSRLETRSDDDKKKLLWRLQERLSTKTNVEMWYYYKMRLDVVLEGIRGKVGGISGVSAL